jgi:serine/threonine protein kinase
MGERQFGPYRLVHQIAVGGMAEIHLAKTRGIAGFEKYVALKMIHPNFSQDDQFIQMLIDEAKITVQLQHVNIAQTFDLGRVSDTYYITMEFVDGADLYKLLRKGSERNIVFPVDAAAYIAKEMSTGLDYAHRKRDVTGQSLGIVHRDVSPQNVLISHAGEVKIVDFGIAKATMRARQTAVGVIKGKYYYMSPEQAWGDPLDHRSDVFSAGIVLYEMLTGQMLYLEEDLHKLLDMVRKANIRPPTQMRRDIPPQLERIVMHALQKDANARYQTAADFATDLERFLHVYSPVFTGSKVAEHFRNVLDTSDPPIEVKPKPAPAPQPPPVPPPRRRPTPVAARDPNLSTQQIERDMLIQDRSEFTDENSVIFRVQEFQERAEAERDEFRGETHTTSPAGLPRGRSADAGTLSMSEPDVLDNIEEQTVISGPPGFGTGNTPRPQLGRQSVAQRQTALSPDPDGDFEPTVVEGGFSGHDEPDDDEDGPTITRSPSGRMPIPSRQKAPPVPNQGRLRPKRNMPAHPALSASTPQPAVSELRKPRQSRRTPAGGVPVQAGGGGGGASLLSAIVQRGDVSMPMQQTRPLSGRGGASDGVPTAQAPGDSQMAQHQVPQQPMPHNQHPLPLTAAPSTPHQGAPHMQMQQPGAFPLAAPMQTPNPFLSLPSGPAMPSLTKQLQAIELEVIPDAYKIGNQSRWLVRGILAFVIIVAGAVGGFLLLRDNKTAVESSILIESNPKGATVKVDGVQLSDKTPVVYEEAETGGRHTIEVTLGDGYKAWKQEFPVPKGGGESRVFAFLKKDVVRLNIISDPSGATVKINDKVVGTTPVELKDLVPGETTEVTLEKKGYQTTTENLSWEGKTRQEINVPLDKKR